MTKTRKPGISRRSTLALMGAAAVTFATPWVARAQAKTDQGRHADHPVRPRRATRNLVAQRAS